MDARKARLLKVMIGLALAAALLGCVALRLDVPAWARQGMESVRAAGAPVFFLAMMILPLVGFPLAPFVFSAGPLFAPTMGAPAVIGCCIGAVAVNVTVAYWFARRALRPWMEHLIRWLGYPMPKMERADSWEFTLLMRLLPGVPFFVQSYLLGLAQVRLGIYLLVSVLVPAGYILAAVVAGDALIERNHTRLLWAGILFAGIGLVLHGLRKRYARVKRNRGDNA